jgi:hypothetical protein
VAQAQVERRTEVEVLAHDVEHATVSPHATIELLDGRIRQILDDQTHDIIR